MRGSYTNTNTNTHADLNERVEQYLSAGAREAKLPYTLLDFDSRGVFPRHFFTELFATLGLT